MGAWIGTKVEEAELALSSLLPVDAELLALRPLAWTRVYPSGYPRLQLAHLTVGFSSSRVIP